MKRKELGAAGEEMAVQYLTSKGYHIITRNYYTRYGELDIVCRKNRSLVFVEVKTRRSTQFGAPEESITPRKIEHLKKAAMMYLNENQSSFREMRFDIISILLMDDKRELRHLEAAF